MVEHEADRVRYEGCDVVVAFVSGTDSVAHSGFSGGKMWKEEL